MSRLMVVVRPALVTGFRLAGVEVYPAEDVETAQELAEQWLDEGEAGLLAVDDGLLERMDSGILERLEDSDTLFHVAIPGGEPLGETASRQHRLAEMIRRAIGFHITFRGEEEEQA